MSSEFFVTAKGQINQMVGPPPSILAGQAILNDPDEYQVSFHTTGEGRVTMQIVNGPHSRIFVGFIEDAGDFIETIQKACVRAEAIELALKGN